MTGKSRNRQIISYSLFEPARLYNERVWDHHKANARRYWFNLPAIAVINQRIYPGFTTQVHVSANCRKQGLFPVLDLLSEQVPGFEYTVNESAYTEFEPAIWRMAPFWDEETSILLCRDTDSIPNGSEWGATRLFLNSNAGLHSIRSHPHHKEPLRLLGGLCGFRPERLISLLPVDNYEAYLALAPHTSRNSDQTLLNRVFAQDPALTATEMIDSPIDRQHSRAEFPCLHMPPQGRLDVNLKIFEIFQWIQREKLVTWAGEPCSIRGAKLRDLLKLTGHTGLFHALRRDKSLKRFYLGIAGG
jgi:hypothetical protein